MASGRDAYEQCSTAESCQGRPGRDSPVAETRADRGARGRRNAQGPWEEGTGEALRERKINTDIRDEPVGCLHRLQTPVRTAHIPARFSTTRTAARTPSCARVSRAFSAVDTASGRLAVPDTRTVSTPTFSKIRCERGGLVIVELRGAQA